jgi:RNA polymerase sigma factor (sigma-70 family)
MPFRDREIRDKDTGEIVEVIKEKLPKYYLSNDSEQHALNMRKWYKGYITNLVYKYSRRSGVYHKDLIDEAYLGLARAVRDFRANAGPVTNRNPRFHNFAVFKIREALREAVYVSDSPINIPFKLRETYYYITRIMGLLDAVPELYQDDVDKIIEEYAVDLSEYGISQGHAKQINYFKDRIAVKAANADSSYERLVKRAREIPRQLFVDSFHTTDFQEAFYEVDEERLDRANALERISKVLDQREYEMLIDYEIEGMTVEMLKDKYDVSIGRVSQIINKARQKVQDNREYIMEGNTY